MPDDDRAQIEAMRLMVGNVFSQMGRELEGFAKKAKDASSEGGGVKQLDSLFVGMTRNLAGPIGLASAIFTVTKSLENFAIGRVQLQAFSTDVGASVPLINAMTVAMGKAGISLQEANTTMTTLGGLIKGLAAEGEGSPLGKVLLDTNVSANRIRSLIETAKTDRDRAIVETIEILNQGSAQMQSYRAAHLSLAQSHVQALRDTQKEMGKVFVADIEAARKWHEDWETVTRGVSNAWSRMYNTFLQTYAKIPREKIDETLNQVEKGLKPTSKSLLDRLLSGDKSPLLESERGPSSPSRYPLSDALNNWLGGGGSTFDERFGKWPGTGQPRATDFGGMRRRTDDDLIEIERDSNKTLRDILDIFQRSETIGGEAGHTGYPTGQARRSLADRLGVNTNTSGGGGRTPGVGPTTLRQGDDPRGLETHIRESAARHGVDPDTAVAVAKSEGLRNFSGDRGTSFGAFQLHTGGGLGDEFKKETGLDPSDPANERATIDWAMKNVNRTGWGPYHGAARTGIGPRAGIGSLDRSAGGGGGGVPSSILNEARSVAQLGGGPAVQQYIRSKGYHVDSAWCGDFAAAVVRGAGGTPPKGYPVASNWRNWGKPVEGDPQPGDIAVRRDHNGFPVRTGSTGSHVNIVDAYDPETGKFRGIGGNQSRTVSNFDRNRFDFRRGEDLNEARRQMDKTSSPQIADANMSATVDFKNMPSWVKSSVDDNGKFKELRVTRSTPQAGKASSPQSDLQNWSYE